MPVKPAIAVGREHVERLVDPRPRPPDDHRVAGQRAEEAEHHRPAGADEAARRRDQHAADDDRRRCADRGHPPAPDQVEDEPGEQRAGRRQQGVDEGEHARVAGRDAAAAVEAEPAEPQQAGADQDVDGVVGEERLAPVVFARADDQCRGQRREAGAHLDRDAAGEVERPLLGQPAAAEGPVGEHRVDQHRPERREDHPGAEPHPLHHRAGDQRHGDDAEGPLEGHEDEMGDRPFAARLEADPVQRRHGRGRRSAPLRRRRPASSRAAPR